VRLLDYRAIDYPMVEASVAPIHKYWLRARKTAMKRKITGYNKDEYGDWRAELDCGHYQHVRHDPPLITRAWVLTEGGRESHLGFELNCKRCDEESNSEEVFRQCSG
jgi:hypothetical protein